MTVSKDQYVPLVVVVGSTGKQGGSVIQELIHSTRPYRIRGLTRDPTKPAAQKLKTQGVEIFKADINSENAEGIAAAFEGAEIIFGVTNFWEHLSMEKEVNDGKAMVDAAKKVGARLFIWSSLPDVNEASGGKYKAVEHFDGKASVTKYAQKKEVPIVEVQAAFYASNLIEMHMIEKGPDGSLTLCIPTSPETLIAVIDVTKDYGLFVVTAIENKSSPGTVVPSFSELISCKDMCREFEEVTGKKLTHSTMSYVEYAANAEKSGMPSRVANEMMEMFQYFEDYGLYAKSAKELTAEKKALNLPRPTTTFKEFVMLQDLSALL